MDRTVDPRPDFFRFALTAIGFVDGLFVIRVMNGTRMHN
jgi:hypothetical protein